MFVPLPPLTHPPSGPLQSTRDGQTYVQSFNLIKVSRSFLPKSLHYDWPLKVIKKRAAEKQDESEKPNIADGGK
jgi:hypothetical protein